MRGASGYRMPIIIWKFISPNGSARMIELSHHVAILDSEIEMMAIRAQGPGRQHVNKTSMAVHLRFDIRAPNLPEFYKQRLLNASHHLITREGIVVIKVQSSRRLALNREAAIERLVSLIRELTVQQKS